MNDMNMLLRESQHSDIPFMEKMLYEAVFWRAGVERPTFEEALAAPGVCYSLDGWGLRDGDTGVVATVGSTAVGAAWYRYWTDDNYINGYIDSTTPVLVIGVNRDYRRLGIGSKMIEWLIDRASEQAIPRISLSVSKENHALELYRQQRFLEYTDNGDAYLMVRTI